MRYIAALAGSPLPPSRIAAIHGRTEGGILRISTIRRAASVAEAMAGIPDLLPTGPPRVDVLAEASDFIGGPVLLEDLSALAGAWIVDRFGRPTRRRWWIHGVQCVAGQRISDGGQWATDIPRRTVVAALVSAGLRGRVKIPSDLPLASALETGIPALRQRRELHDEERMNPEEDLALCLALCAWWHSVETEGRRTPTAPGTPQGKTE